MECKYVWQQNQLKTNIKRRKYRDTSFTIVYPSDKIKQAKFYSSQQISTFLLKDALEIGFCQWQIFQKAVVDKGDYIKIIYTCKKKSCQAILIYHQRKQNPKDPASSTYNTVYLTQQKIINKHRHVLRLTPKISSQQSIRQYLYDLPVEQRLQNHVSSIQQKFNLSKCQARYLKDRIFWKFKNQDHMLKKLTQRKVAFRRKIQDGKTVILILMSQQMKRCYKFYGDVLCFDLTYRLLKKRRKQMKHVGVGFFVGQDQNSRIVLFAMATIQHETSQHFQQLFQFFFQLCQHPPETIITDDQKALTYAFQKIKKAKKYQFVHLLDWLHKMQAMKRVLKKQPYNQQIQTLVNRSMKQPSKKIYMDILTQIAGMLQNQKTIKDFVHNQWRYCLAYAPQKYFGFGINSSRAEAFNNLIKRSIPYQTNLSRLVYFVLRVQKRLLNRMAILNYMNKQILVNIHDKQILYLSQNLQHLAFQQIRQYFEQSRTFELVPLSEPNNKALIITKQTKYLNSTPTYIPIYRQVVYYKYERQYKFNLMYDLKCDCWRCECKNNFRTGMPCTHIVKIVRQCKGSISYYINERWIHDKKNVKIKKASRPNIKNKKI